MRAPINMIVGSGLGARGSGQDRLSLRLRGGQALLEYAVLVGAVILGVVAAASLTYRAFVAQAQEVEKKEMVF